MSHNSKSPARIPNTPIDQKNPKTFQKTVIEAEGFRGPLPHPDAFERYESVLTGSAERILKMAESQANHRHEMERVIVHSNVFKERRGQVFALISLIATLITAGVCAYLEQPIPASVLGGGGICGIIITFITGVRHTEKAKGK